MKFGGASVAVPENFSAIAALVQTKAQRARIVVVVSAMGDTTDHLLALAKRVHPTPPPREQDMLVTVGERIAISLLAMALDRIGTPAVSFTGSQSGILTTADHSNAKIIDVRAERIAQVLDAGKVAIVAGFQGVSPDKEITTLGRGGSDTTAVALGLALRATHVEFYKDVQGIYSADPKRDPCATLLHHLSHREALALCAEDASVLHPRCIALAAKHALPLNVLSYRVLRSTQAHGTWIVSEKEHDGAVAYETD